MKDGRSRAAEEGSLKLRAAVGGAWTVGGHGASVSLRLLSNVLLAWLLFPEAFGLMALVAVVISALQLFSDVGLHASVVRDERGDDPGFLNNVFTLGVIRGVLLWAAGWLAAAPMAAAYGEPRLAELVPVAAAACLLRGCRSANYMWNQRHLRYRYVTAVEVSEQVVRVASMAWLAWLWQDVWAMVIGGLIADAVGMLLTHLLLPGPRSRLAWHTATVVSVLRFGRWLFVGTALTFFANMLDKLLLGLLVPLGVLGVYQIGFVLATAPVQLIQRINRAVLFPALATHDRSRPEALGEKVELARRTVLLAVVLVVLAVAMLSPLFFRVLYQPAYHDAGWMAQLLCFSVWFTALSGMSSSALLARGVTWVFAGSQMANGLVTLAGCLAGYHLLGMAGFILGYGLGTFSGYLVVQHAMTREGMATWRQDVRFTAGLVVLVAAGVAGQQLVGGVWSGYAGLALEAAVAAVVLGAYGIWAGEAILKALSGEGWRGLGRRVEGLVRGGTA